MATLSEVTQLASRVRLLLMDVDGVLTDGRLINVPDAAGNMVETKGFDSQDGIALQWMSWKGIYCGLISGRVSPATAERAKQCKFPGWADPNDHFGACPFYSQIVHSRATGTLTKYRLQKLVEIGREQKHWRVRRLIMEDCIVALQYVRAARGVRRYAEQRIGGVR